MNRIDQIGHSTDQWGQVTPEAEKSRITPGDYSSHYMYEVMFKNDINLLDYLDRVNVTTEEQRDVLIKKFKEKGISEVGGKSPEELIRIKPEGQWKKENLVHKMSFFNTVTESKTVNKAINHIANEHH